MKDWVKEKIEKINMLFPPERISKSKERWRRIWDGEKTLDRYPFVFGPITFNYYDDNHPPDDRLKVFLDEFIYRGKLNDDFIPTFFPGCKQSTMPNMLGAKEIFIDNDYTCEPIINSYSDIDKLPPASMEQGTVAYDWLFMQQYLLKETEGCIPIHVTDMQGPADVCGQLWGYDNFLMAAYTDPEYFHKIMDITTKAFIMFWEKQKHILGDCFMGTHLFGWDWVPENFGASLSADSLVMISPQYYEDFYKPYLVEIGKHFGGLSVHSCGDFSAVIKNLCNTEYMKALNAGQMNLEELLDAGVDNSIVVIAKTNVKDVKKESEIIAKNNLRVDLTIHIETLPNNMPETWTTSDWNKIKKSEEKIIEYMCKLS